MLNGLPGGLQHLGQHRPLQQTQGAVPIDPFSPPDAGFGPVVQHGLNFHHIEGDVQLTSAATDKALSEGLSDDSAAHASFLFRLP